MNKDSQVNRLLQHAFFRELDPLEAKALFSAGKVQPVQAGQTLFEENSPEDGLFFVLSGVFEVRMNTPALNHAPLANVQAGEVIGEIGLLNRRARTATVVAVSDAFVWHLNRSVFEGLLARGDALASGLLRGIAEDLCRRFRAGVYEGASLMAELAPNTATRIQNGAIEWEIG
jgi:CRP-like cAMP-binding protein